LGHSLTELLDRGRSAKLYSKKISLQRSKVKKSLKLVKPTKKLTKYYM